MYWGCYWPLYSSNVYYGTDGRDSTLNLKQVIWVWNILFWSLIPIIIKCIPWNVCRIVFNHKDTHVYDHKDTLLTHFMFGGAQDWIAASPCAGPMISWYLTIRCRLLHGRGMVGWCVHTGVTMRAGCVHTGVTMWGGCVHIGTTHLRH